jgi:hypothetical protein
MAWQFGKSPGLVLALGRANLDGALGYDPNPEQLAVTAGVDQRAPSVGWVHLDNFELVSVALSDQM